MNTFKLKTDKYGLSLRNFNSYKEFQKAKRAAAMKLWNYRKKIANSTLIGPLAL